MGRYVIERLHLDANLQINSDAGPSYVTDRYHLWYHHTFTVLLGFACVRCVSKYVCHPRRCDMCRYQCGWAGIGWAGMLLFRLHLDANAQVNIDTEPGHVTACYRQCYK